MSNTNKVEQAMFTTPTQRDVAKAAGVSSATVSRYLASPDSVRPAAAEQVKKAIEALGYQVDHSAQSLKTGRFFNIGILTPGIGPFYWEVTHAIQSLLNENGYFTSLFITRDIDNQFHSYRDRLPPFLKKRYLDGIIFFPYNTREDDQLLELLEQWGRPFIVMDRAIANPSIYQLTVDNYHAGWHAAEILINKGHRDFLFIWGTPQVPSAYDRYQGFSARLAEAGIPLGSERQIFGDFFAEPTYQAVSKALPSLPPFSAVFASNDSSSLGFIRAAHEVGLECPKDYSIIGFDNNPEYARHIIPSLSTFSQPLRELGLDAARLLLTLINGGEAEHRCMYKPQYIERESVSAKL
ncbi:MAG: LacI family transcriptional regulator [Spirochaetes bacterium]|nr:LacI family transcriptional regulator [Spirochaetota bacterium]MBU0954579.1 LacI family transcriptional regulator [Spirochaetota bacterium]